MEDAERARLAGGKCVGRSPCAQDRGGKETEACSISQQQYMAKTAA